jgi:hypothetical protein
VPLSPENRDRSLQSVTAELANGRHVLLLVVAIALSLGVVGCSLGSKTTRETTGSTTPAAGTTTRAAPELANRPQR